MKNIFNEIELAAKLKVNFRFLTFYYRKILKSKKRKKIESSWTMSF
jgi:hypothetical protein